MNEVLISVIVPVYNVSRFLNRCVDSLLNQTYKNIEIILVDDGATDGSSSICDEYQKKEPRIHVIHKGNEGCSSARNEALKTYRGEELVFVDPDDYVEPAYIEKLHYCLQEQDVDVVICNFDYVDEDGEHLHPSKQKMPEGKHNKNELLYNYILFNKDVFYMTVLWNKIYKREIIGDFMFPCKYRNYEDSYWCPYIFAKCKCGYVIDDVLYHYTVNYNSLTHKSNSGNKKEAYKYICTWKRSFFLENTDIKEAKLVALVEEKKLQSCLYKKDFEWRRNIRKNYREVYINGEYRTTISKTRKLKFFIAFLSLDLYCFLAKALSRK